VKRYLISFFLVVLLSAFRPAAAQCSFKFVNGMSVYTSVSADTHSNIYTDVTLDGTDQMQISGGCQLPPGIYHLGVTTNTVSSGSGVRYGGSSASGHTCANCYVSDVNTQSFPAGTDTTWTFQWDGEVICSSAGGVYYLVGSGLIGLHVANYKFVSYEGGPSECTYNLSCPNGNAKAYCGAQVPTVQAHTTQDCAHEYIHDLRIGVGGKCIPFGSATPSATAIWCN
jgi:hypothetical protein